jgi:hypothetical protein
MSNPAEDVPGEVMGPTPVPAAGGPLVGRPTGVGRSSVAAEDDGHRDRPGFALPRRRRARGMTRAVPTSMVGATVAT